MNHHNGVLQRLIFLLAGMLVLGLAACGEHPGVPRQGQQAAQQPAQVAQPVQQQAQPAQQAQPVESEAAAPAESAPPASGEEREGEGDLAAMIHELEEVKAEDVPLTTGAVECELKDFEFVPHLFRVKAGEVTFIFNNTSTHAHNYRISAWDDHEKVIYPGPKIGARKKRKVTIKLEPGVYYVLCNLSDHEERGMVGKLFVEP